MPGMHSWEWALGLLSQGLGLGTDGQTDGQTDRLTNGQTRHAYRQTCSPVSSVSASGMCGGEPLRLWQRLLERWSGQAARSAGAVAVYRELRGLRRALGAAVSATPGSIGKAKSVRCFDRGGTWQSNGKSVSSMCEAPVQSALALFARKAQSQIILPAAVSQCTVYLSGGRKPRRASAL